MSKNIIVTQANLAESQNKELKRITKFFLEAVDPIEDQHERGIVSAKILSRLACFADRLTCECEKCNRE